MARLQESTRKWESNIRKVYAAADADALQAGGEWYAAAADALRPYTVDGGGLWTREQAAAVCAVLSPRIAWKENLKGVQRMYQAAADGNRVCPPVAGVRKNVERGWYIAQTGDVSVVSGPKVSSFYANLCGDFQRVTLDTWAARAAGVPASCTHIDRARYQRLQRSYQRVAAEYGHAPAVFQAIVWVAVRGRAH